MPRRTAIVDSPDSTDAADMRLNDTETDSDGAARVEKSASSTSKSRSRRRPSAPFADASNDFPIPLNDESPLPRRSLQKSTSAFTEVDDRAEKRKRRKSARVSFVASPEDEAPDTFRGEAESSGSALALEKPRLSMKTGRLSSGAPLRINAVAPAPAPVVSMDVMSSNFEEWMKMATDNKINAANSWNFALIDYFHDMSLLRNTDDNTINFQKASFTLDGCVKIWTSRVDSVGTETGKLLSNLAQDNGPGETDGDDEDGVDGDGEQSKKKQKVHRTEATLVKSYSQLQVKKLDLDFAVDPLFRKTRAEFDEGGAMGLLMNHLGVNSKMQVVFDSGDSKLSEENDDYEEEIHQTIDLDQIRGNLLPSLDTLDGRTIAQDLAEFRFSSDTSKLDFTFLTKARDEDDPDASFASHRLFIKNDAPNVSGDGGLDDNDFEGGDFDGGGPVEDFFTGDQAVDEGPQSGPVGFAPFGVDDEDNTGVVVGVVEPFDPRRAPNERDLVMAMNVNGNDDGEMLDYFDANFMKNWAGPEHWKMRRVNKKADASANDAPKARRERTVFTIAFLDPPAHTAKQLFVPAVKSSLITLPASGGAFSSKSSSRTKKKFAKRDDHLLPDDMHFTSQQLLRLFLKPKFTLRMRRYGVATGQLNDKGDGEVDQHFWAGANQLEGASEIDQTAGGGAIPFNTQFFHDDYDDEGQGFDDDPMIDDADGPMIPLALDAEEGDLLAATQGPLKRVRPEFVNYARKAKRVDVRKLKENIWRGLKIVTPKDKDGPELVPNENLTDPNQPSNFNSVIRGLRSTYSPEKMEEISTSFCFICLLHLANERGLKIEVGKDSIIEDDDGENGDSEGKEDEQRRVGDIWGLNVFRDPTAATSA